MRVTNKRSLQFEASHGLEQRSGAEYRFLCYEPPPMSGEPGYGTYAKSIWRKFIHVKDMRRSPGRARQRRCNLIDQPRLQLTRRKFNETKIYLTE